MTTGTELTCRCGQAALRVDGPPILSTECLCSDCRTAGAIFQNLPGAAPVLDGNRTTRFVLYRKDRVRCLRGAEHLREHRLTPDSKTRRVVAVCCNTPLFLDFTQGHWLSVYGQLWSAGNLPPLELRTMVRDAPAGVTLPGNVPNLKSHGLRFFVRLIGAWAAMGFGSPKVDFVQGELHVMCR